MMQVENEYGSYGNDRNYIKALKKLWVDDGIDVPFYTADGPTVSMLTAGSIDSAAMTDNRDPLPRVMLGYSQDRGGEAIGNSHWPSAYGVD